MQLRRADGLNGPIGDLGVFWQVAHHHAGANGDAFGFELFGAAVDVRLFHFEIRNAVAQQTPNAVVLFKQGHIVTHTCQLLCSGHACGTCTNDRYFLAGFVFGGLWRDPTFGPRTVNDGVLDRLDAHRIAIEIQGACSFARCGANATSELWKVVGAVQHGDGVFPIALVHQVIEIRNDVVDRATVVAKRCAAIHATRRLCFGLLVV